MKSKRTDDLAVEAVQQGNATWWDSNPMTYDWTGTNSLEPYSAAWFDEIDKRFIEGSRLFATDHEPFDRLIPFAQLAGKRVLEIGCGMGFHSELLARSGAKLTSVDLTPQAIKTTQARLALKGLAAEVRQADAEALPFEAGSFDFVWSWGVIHHSSRTARIVREIARVLRAPGEARVMVYRRDGVPAKVGILLYHYLRGGFLRQSVEETLYKNTDGFSARYYVREQFEDLFRAFFQDVSAEVLGQEADALPLPRRLRNMVRPLVGDARMRQLQARWGGFLFLTAKGVE